MSPEFRECLPEGDIIVPVGEVLRLEFGQLKLEVRHLNYEWQLSYVYGQRRTDSDLMEYGEEKVLRFVFDSSCDTLSMQAMLADRAVVSRPLSPIGLSAGASTCVYISTPLWLGIDIGGQRVLELTTVRLSDTWFGDKSAGELCYSDTTRARLDPSAVENLYFKAVTPVTIKNQSNRQLLLDRINVPVPMLPLYRQTDQSRSFVTAAISATLHEGERDSRVEMAPEQAHSQDLLISPARRPQRRQFLYRALDMFMS